MRSHRLSVLSAALAVALSFVSIEVSALTLGNFNAKSALGEPLRAEIDISDVSAAEADGLKANIASPEMFQAQGLPYNSNLAGVDVTVGKRGDGSFVIRLNGSKSMNDPFLDIFLEANWSFGQVFRDYIVLLDLPASPIPAQAALPTLAQQTGEAWLPWPPVQGGSQSAQSSFASASGAAGQQVTVQRGDTAGKIATTYKPDGVSLDQMLVALMRSNPDAFIGGNVNRIKSGAVLSMPSDAEARAASPSEAVRTVRTRSNNFGGYRQRLAEQAPALRASGSDRQTSGKLRASVEDRKASRSSPDKLKISQGGPAVTAADDKLAKKSQAQAMLSRTAEIAKNLSDLTKVQAASGLAAMAAAASAPTTVAGAIAVPVAALASVVNAATATVAQAAPAVLPAIVAPAANVVAQAPLAVAKPRVVAAPAPVAEPEAIFGLSSLLDNPIVLAFAALVAALIAFVVYRLLARRPSSEGSDSVFVESKIARDSFFGVSGGRKVDTNDRHTSAHSKADVSGDSSLSYSPSQLDLSDVDPVAEADVYLAYGRDLQAEEILREAIRIHPERVAAPLKLLEIHAKRRDLRAFEALTGDIRKLTSGAGPEWARAIQLGRELDPANPLYQTNVPTKPEPLTAVAPLSATSAAPLRAPTVPMPLSPAVVHSVIPMDFDLGLPEPVAPAASMSVAKFEAEFGSRSALDTLQPLPGMKADAGRTPPARAPVESSHSGFINFDLSMMPQESTGSPEDGGEHPHAIKLSLARELHAIGDTEGARSLAGEVASGGSGELQIKAKQLLAQLT